MLATVYGSLLFGFRCFELIRTAGVYAYFIVKMILCRKKIDETRRHLFLIGAHKVTIVEPDVLQGLYQLLSNYNTYQDSLERLKQTLRNLIKPDSVLNNSFI